VFLLTGANMPTALLLALLALTTHAEEPPPSAEPAPPAALAPVWTEGGRCLAGICTGEPLDDPSAWERVEVVPGGELHRLVELPEPWVELGVMVDTRSGRVALVSGWLQGREACEAARDSLDAMVEKKGLETSVDWWTWKTGQSVRLHPRSTPRRAPTRVILEACEIDRMDPRFDDRTGQWDEPED
jgi:hypothetical protein